MSEWNPEQYARFERERSQPFHDLLALVRPAVAMRVVDLGCGTGELTRVLHRTLRAASTIGIDSSETMLAKAAAIEEPGLSFELASIEAYAASRPLDLVFSNAALQWVDDHPALLDRLGTLVAPDGQLAVQIPANDAHPSHRVAAEVALEEPFREALGGWTRVFPNLGLHDYARALDRLGFRDQHVRLQIYPHRLGSRDDVVEWVKGTLLTAYRARLPEPLRARFEARYRARLREVLPDESPFFFPFARILFWGAR